MQPEIALLSLREGNLHCALHINPELEILFVRAGELTVWHEDFSETLSAGEATLVLPYHLHRFTPSEDCNATVLMFSFALAEDFYKSACLQNKVCKKIRLSPELQQYAEIALAQHRKEEQPLLQKSLFFTLLAPLAAAASVSSSNACDTDTVRRMLECLSLHLEEPLSLSEFCHHLGMSERTATKIFSKQLGITFQRLRNNLRMDRAIALLTHTEQSVTEIAFACGFGCLRSFNRVFAEYTKTTPKEFRKSLAEIQKRKERVL